MSTELGKIKGRYETLKGAEKIKYKENSIYLTSFYGGKKKGLMLQITIDNPQTTYSQLTKEQANKLINKLNEWLMF